jgi:O-antigen/teichoic acid export membrane protein
MNEKTSENSFSHVLKYTSIFGGVQGLSILIGIVRNKLAALLIGPVGFGLVSLFNSTVKLVSDSSNLGLSFSAVRHISELFSEGDVKKINNYIGIIRAWSLLTALIGMVLCIVASPLLNRWTFTWGNHTLHFIMLSPIVFFTAITGGELAILKGARKLHCLAMISLIGVFMSLLISVPIYYYFGESGIIPVMLLIAATSMLTTIAYSYKIYPPFGKTSFCTIVSCMSKQLHDGLPMLRLGIAFLLAGVLGSGAELIIRSFLNNEANLPMVGFYNAGYTLVMTYASMVFTAMETDYFPRLSSVNRDNNAVRETVNRQIEVTLLIISPMLVVFMVSLPILLPLLYSSKFMPVIAMTQVAVFSMFFRAINLPLEYVPLAKGLSMTYLFLEAAYDIFIIFAVIYGYQKMELVGTGVALSCGAFFNFIMMMVYSHLTYNFYLSKFVVRVIILQLPLLVIAYICTLYGNTALSIVIQIVMAVVSVYVSINILRKKTSLWKSIIFKINSHLHHG